MVRAYQMVLRHVPINNFSFKFLRAGEPLPINFGRNCATQGRILRERYQRAGFTSDVFEDVREEHQVQVIEVDGQLFLSDPSLFHWGPIPLIEETSVSVPAYPVSNAGDPATIHARLEDNDLTVSKVPAINEFEPYAYYFDLSRQEPDFFPPEGSGIARAMPERVAINALNPQTGGLLTVAQDIIRIRSEVRSSGGKNVRILREQSSGVAQTYGFDRAYAEVATLLHTTSEQLQEVLNRAVNLHLEELD